MLVLGLDFETTFTDPVDPNKCRIIEAGAVLWDTNTRMPLRLLNQVTPWRFGPFDPRVTELTGLTDETLEAHGRPLEVILGNLVGLMQLAEHIVAHNGNMFDKPLFFAEMRRANLEVPTDIQSKLWLDTSVDVPYPAKIETRKLDFLAPSHGFLNPFAHRAIFDVLSMLKVLSHYDIHDVVRRATAPKAKLRAITQPPWTDGGVSNKIAKERGFRYEADTKTWVKTVLADEVQAEINKGGLTVEEIK